MGRAWGPQLQIPFGPQHHQPAGKEEAADLLLGVGWGASVSKCGRNQLNFSQQKKSTRQNPASIPPRPFSLLDAEIGNDATTYWGVSYVLSTLVFTWSDPILIKVIWVTCYPQSIGEETETITHDRQLVKPDARKTPSSAWPMARVPDTVEWVVAHTLMAQNNDDHHY